MNDIQQHPNPKPKIGLALSGGGSRAAAFHLGVLSALDRLGILQQVDVISSVSGGSILAAQYLLRKNQPDFDFNQFRDQTNILLQKNLYYPIVFNLLRSWNRTKSLAHAYDKTFFERRTLGELPQYPKLIINATNLAAGNAWTFDQKTMGHWRSERTSSESYPIANAVAASSAYPFLSPPLEIATDDGVAYICDGGFYDNLGLHALRNEECDYIICSDGSAPFIHKQLHDKFLIFNSKLVRQVNTMMYKMKNSQINNLKETHKGAFINVGLEFSLEESLIYFEYDKNRIYKTENRKSFNQYKAENPLNGEKLTKKLSEYEFPEGFESGIISNQNIRKISNIATTLAGLALNDCQLLQKHGDSLTETHIRLYAKQLLTLNISSKE